MWFFGALITFGLLSSNLDSVQAGAPTLPYVLASTGYPGLLLVTLLFVWRFLASLESPARAPAVHAFALAQAASPRPAPHPAAPPVPALPVSHPASPHHSLPPTTPTPPLPPPPSPPLP